MKKQEQKPSNILIDNPKLYKRLRWLLDQKSNIFTALGVIAIVLMIIFKFVPSKNEVGARLAEKAYSQWNESSDEKNYKELNRILKKYPDLKLKYEGLIVQKLLEEKDLIKGDFSIANTALSRTQEELPLYGMYARASVLIAKEDYMDALEQSRSLKKQILEDFSFLKDNTHKAGAVLFSFNLLRIAFLEQKLNHPKEELFAWLELENYFKDDINPKIQEAKKAIEYAYKENTIELKDYISHRKSLITSINP